MSTPTQTDSKNQKYSLPSDVEEFVPSSLCSEVMQHDGEADDLEFNPYNPANQEITPEEVMDILSKYNGPTKIHNFALFRRAFIHRSYTKRPDVENQLMNVNLAARPDDCLELSTKSNERLEFLGDGVLELIVKFYLYRRFPKEDEGFMTEKKIALVKNEHIGKLAQAMGLHKWFILSRNAEEKNTRTNLKKLGCLFEAFVGAIFLDSNKYSITDDNNVFSAIATDDDDYEALPNFITGHGFNYAQRFVESVLEQEVDWTRLINVDDNFKHQLQIRIQKTFKTTPHYIQLDTLETGEVVMCVCLCLNQQIYETSIDKAVPYDEIGSFDNILKRVEDGAAILVKFGEGTHKMKKKAEQLACLNALKLLDSA